MRKTPKKPQKSLKTTPKRRKTSAAMGGHLARLRRLDALLAGSGGLHVAETARQQGLSQRTIHRDLALLGEMGCRIVVVADRSAVRTGPGSGKGQHGAKFFRRYADGKRLFADE